MSTTTKKHAGDIGVVPVYIKGMEKHGLTYESTQGKDDVMGAQCGYCHTVVWFDSRRDPILAEDAPASVPDSGPIYREYYQSKLRRFLQSIPACPQCRNRSYDYFINNVSYPRHADGTPVNVSWDRKIEYVYVPAETAEVWWYAAQ